MLTEPQLISPLIQENNEDELETIYDIEGEMLAIKNKLDDISKSDTDDILDNLWSLIVDIGSNNLTNEETFIKEKMILELKDRLLLNLL